MITRRILGLGLAAPALAAAVPRALAQGTGAWPNRPLRMIIPWPPGQATDLIGRIAASWLSEKLGQSVVPENKAGAAGMIGSELVARAAPDGYTLLSSSGGPITFSPLVQRVPYDVDKDFATIIAFGAAPYVLLVKPDFPAADARAFVALLKANPGKYSFASSGTGGSQHLVTAVFNARAGVDTLHVPFPGSGPAMAALMSGTVDYAIDTPAGSNALVRQGALKALGQTFSRPTALLPGIPPLSEAADLPGYDIGGWNGLMTSAGVPRPIIDRLYTVMAAGLATPEVRDRFASLGVEIDVRTPEGYTEVLHQQRDLFVPLIRQLGIRAE